jgi:hypothetical protein
MSILSEDVKTVISCSSLTANTLYTEELKSETILSDNVTTNSLTLVDPLNPGNTGTLVENGTTLEITAPTVKINGNAVITGTLTLPVRPPNANGYFSGTVEVNDVVAPHKHTLVFTTGLLQSYTYV